MELLKINIYKGMLVSVNSKVVTLTRTEIGGTSRGKIEISNTHETQNVAYKIKNSCPQLFSVKPTTGVLEPGGTAVCKVKYKFNLVPDRDAMKIKFMVLSTLTDLTPNEQQLTEGFWEYLKNKKKDEIQQQVLKINIVSNINKDRVNFNKDAN